MQPAEYRRRSQARQNAERGTIERPEQAGSRGIPGEQYVEGPRQRRIEPYKARRLNTPAITQTVGQDERRTKKWQN